MDVSNDVIENPLFGDRIVFRTTGDDTDGELLEFDLFMEPGAHGPPAHVHPKAEETFEVRAGEVCIEYADDEVLLTEGERFTVESGTAHTWRNATNAKAHMRIRVRPALRFKSFLETIYGLAQDGHTNADGVPTFLQLSVTAPAFFDVTYVATPPLVVQKIIFWAVRPLAHLLGYEAEYPYPYAD